MIAKLSRLLDRIYAVPAALPDWGFQFLARLAIAPVFWNSGRLKVNDCSFLDVMALRYEWDEESPCVLRESTFVLFETDWRLPGLDPELAASLATFAEHLLPVMVLVGLATRLGALGLLVMTLVIQFLVLPTWAAWWGTHILWVFLLLYIVAKGPGPLSLDHLLRKFIR